MTNPSSVPSVSCSTLIPLVSLWQSAHRFIYNFSCRVPFFSERIMRLMESNLRLKRFLVYTMPPIALFFFLSVKIHAAVVRFGRSDLRISHVVSIAVVRRLWKPLHSTSHLFLLLLLHNHRTIHTQLWYSICFLFLHFHKIRFPNNFWRMREILLLKEFDLFFLSLGWLVSHIKEARWTSPT